MNLTWRIVFEYNGRPFMVRMIRVYIVPLYLFLIIILFTLDDCFKSSNLLPMKYIFKYSINILK